MSSTTWTDLAAGLRRQLAVEADICVIGAGAAGIYLAKRLVERGCSVVLVEAGPAIGVDAGTVGFEAVFVREPYPAATTGRFFGMGGSTTRWGGALVPHTDVDLRAGDASAKVWERIVSTVANKAPSVLRALGYTDGADFESFAECSLGQTANSLADIGFQVQSGLYLPFRRKNLVGLLDRKTVRSTGLRVFFNAVVMSWEMKAGDHRGGILRRLVAMSRNRNELQVSAEKFVICAGAIESARMLLEMQDANFQPVLRKTARPGCYLGDHLSMPIADVVQDSLDRTVELFAPHFCGAWMRSFRLLEIAAPPGSPRAFGHFIFTNRSRGFDLAKALLGAIQQRRLPRVDLSDVTAGIGELVQLGFGRLFESRLFIPPGTPAHLQLDMEQIPARNNRVSLSEQRDDYGRRLARIDWHISGVDFEAMTASAHRFLSLWPGPKAGLPELQPRVFSLDDDGEGAKPYDAYHPVGTCRMGDDPEAVVDCNLRVWGVHNLWLVSTGVLPSAGTANPTFTILCLAHELAEQLWEAC